MSTNPHRGSTPSLLRASLAALVAASCACWSAPAHPQVATSPWGEGPVTAPPAARVSALEGALSCWGTGDGARRDLMLNDVVGEGDELYLAPGSRAEIEFPGGTFLRMDGGSSLIVVGYQADVEIAATAGASVLSTGDLAQGTASMDGAEVVVDVASMVRLDVTPDGLRSVSTFYGYAHLPEAGLTAVRDQIAWADAPDSPWYVGPWRPRDDFDTWVLDREDAVRPPADVDEPSYPLVGYWELRGHGTWTVVDGVWAWIPDVEPGWRPFSTGEWIWVDGYGWVWASSHSWGWVTSHYGRWIWTPEVGWVWLPGMAWSPAWVSWSWFGGYIGWAPCDWWGHPYVVVGWPSHYWYQAWVLAPYEYFYDSGYHHHGHLSWHHHHQGDGRGAQGASGGASHPRGTYDGAAGTGSGGAQASNDRDDLSGVRQRALGGEFLVLGDEQLDALPRGAIGDAGADVPRAAAMSPAERESFEAGGEARQRLLESRYGAPAPGGEGVAATSPSRTSWNAAPIAPGAATRATIDVFGDGADATPYVPRYEGRSDGAKVYDIGTSVRWRDATRGVSSTSRAWWTSAPTTSSSSSRSRASTGSRSSGSLSSGKSSTGSSGKSSGRSSSRSSSRSSGKSSGNSSGKSSGKSRSR